MISRKPATLGFLPKPRRSTHSLAYQTGSEPGFEYGTNAALYIWNNMTPATPPAPSEGSQCWSFDIAGGTWFGMGVLASEFSKHEELLRRVSSL